MNENIFHEDSKNNIQFLKDTVATVNEKIYQISPVEGKWSIQQILDHLAVTESVILNLSKGPSLENDRDPTAIINVIKEAFGNHNKVYPNPKAVNPSGQSKSKEELLSVIETSRFAYLEEIKTKGAPHLLDLYPHPLTGKMTRIEWLYFNIYHIERHIHQIKMILQNPVLKDA